MATFTEVLAVEEPTAWDVTVSFGALQLTMAVEEPTAWDITVSFGLQSVDVEIPITIDIDYHLFVTRQLLWTTPDVERLQWSSL